MWSSERRPLKRWQVLQQSRLEPCRLTLVAMLCSEGPGANNCRALGTRPQCWEAESAQAAAVDVWQMQKGWLGSCADLQLLCCGEQLPPPM